MFNIFKKSGEKKQEPSEKDNGDNTDNDFDEETEKKEDSQDQTEVNPNLTKISSEVTKIKANIEAFGEVRKSFTERFTRTSEQIGELRAMILERDKNMQELELKAIKAYDLVESVHPEKISSMVQKEDAKIDALKANLEGNEAIMSRVMDELKETKRKIEFFRGVEEVVKLSQEVKQELIEIKKVESRINVNVDKVDTLYSEIRKKFQNIDTFASDIQELKAVVEQNSKDITFLKDKIGSLAEKDELEKIVSRVQRYIDALKELQKKSSMTKDIEQLKTILDSLK
ncbi:MAG TPA: hypothetical protein VJH92_04200 [Candidatus Nanoarchaeia archaeon]|nr:hypothetical protein [Candidatus Nanoarchaeia archaeon]